MQKIYKRLLWLTALMLAVVVCLPGMTADARKKQPATPPAPVKVTVLATAGLNGHIINWDYNIPQTAELGLVKMSSIIKRERQNNSNTLLLDGGNMLSGTPLTNYFVTESSKLPNPMVRMYNYLGYDAVVLGEGELAYGAEYVCTSLAAAKFPVLSANAHNSGKLRNVIKPFTIKEFQVNKDNKKEKILIGVIGVTSASPEALQNYGELTLKDQSTAIDDIAKKLRKKVDAIIVVTNDGLEIDGTTLATPGEFGSSLSRTELTFEKVGKKWHLKQTETMILPAAIAPVDKTLADLAWPYHDATLQYLSKRP